MSSRMGWLRSAMVLAVFSVALVSSALTSVRGQGNIRPAAGIGTGGGPQTNYAYATSPGSNAVLVINTASNLVINNIALSFSPVGIAITPNGKVAYLTDTIDGTVSALNLVTNKVTATIAVGSGPQCIVLNPAGTRAYVANSTGSSISVLDITTNTIVATVAIVANPAQIAVTPDGAQVYVACPGANSVAAINTATYAVNYINVGNSPRGLATAPNTARVYVCNFTDGTISVINTTTGAVTTISAGAGSNPTWATMSPDGNQLYYDIGTTVSVLNTATNTVATTLPSHRDEGIIGFTTDGAFAYLPSTASRSMDVINTATDQLIGGVNSASGGVFQVACVSVPALLANDVPPPAYANSVVPVDGAGAGGAGPSSADVVNLISSVYENGTSDVAVRNPSGPGVVFARSYRTATAVRGYSSPGLSVGWVHNMDITVTTASGLWRALFVRYPNLATETWFPVLDNNGNPTGAFNVPTGAPYIVTGTPGATVGKWNALSVVFKDQSVWTFAPDPNVVNSYLLTQITNIVGRSIKLNYDNLDRLIKVTDDAVTANTLLALAYTNGGYLSSLTEYSDPNNPRGITYGFNNQAGSYVLNTVSQVYFTSAPTNNIRWQYAYTSIVGAPLLSAVSVPNPTGAVGSISNAINYDTTTGKVTSLQDANQNQRVYSPGTTTKIAVQLAGAQNPTQYWYQKFAAPFLDTGTTDAQNNSDTVQYTDTANPFFPTKATDKNGHSVTVNYVAAGTSQPANGNIYQVTDARGVITTNFYLYTLNGLNFSPGWLSEVQTAGKTSTKFAYYDGTTQANVYGVMVTQALGLLKSVSTPQPGTSNTNARVTTTYTYTALGNVASVTVRPPIPRWAARSPILMGMVLTAIIPRRRRSTSLRP